MISLRLGEALEGELEAEARRSGRTRSQLVRQALLEYLAGAERQRRYAGAVAELQGAYGDPASRREALARA
ncbi:MAG: ribbon-helix-helix protein, CopG family, partial [bacterium]|nr:ribbon-helix-helix protein, CopG family [bacterium]